MNRRKLLSVFVAGAGYAAMPWVRAQQRVPRIGLLSGASSASEFPEKQTLESLRKLGWVEGKNVTIEYRYAAGNSKLLSQYAAELVRMKVDVILTFSVGVAPAKAATTTIPVVFGTSQNPVGISYVSSLAKPGGNLTGVTYLTDELSSKRLELLKETMPSASRAAVVWEPAHVDNELKGLQAAAPRLGMELQSIEVPRPTRPDEVERLVQAAVDARARAIILAACGFTIQNRKRIIELAAKHRLPVISAWSIFSEDGAILTYGPDLADMSQRLAAHVDRVLKGSSAAELPVEQPTKFELVVNMKSAKALGVAIPQSLRLRADRVIE